MLFWFVLVLHPLSLLYRKETPRKTDQRGRHWPEKRKESTRGKKVRYNFYHFHIIYLYLPKSTKLKNFFLSLFSGREFRIGPYRVDGFDKENKKVFEFNGCYFHHHACSLTAHIKDAK